MAAITVSNMTKSYGEMKALQGITLAVEEGEFFGLLGPNGAGKSTLIRILATLECPSSGEATVAGSQIGSQNHEIRKKIGVALQDTGVDPLMTGQEILVLAARLFGASSRVAFRRADELLARFQLTDAAHRIVRGYSGGMRRRLDLAVALVHEPDIIILDEPTTGLDPTSRLALWDLLRALSRSEHKTILMTTQYLEEADALCERVVFVSRGKIVAEGTPTSLKHELGYTLIKFDVAAQEVKAAAACLEASDWSWHVANSRFELVSQRPEEDVMVLHAQMSSLGIALTHLEMTPPSLDDVFMHLAAAETGMPSSLKEG